MFTCGIAGDYLGSYYANESVNSIITGVPEPANPGISSV